MTSRKVEYVDYNGDKREDVLYFNLTKTELVDFRYSVDGGLENKIKRISETQDSREIASLIKEIILLSYGEKSDDGKRFKKSKEIRDDFENSIAFDTFFMSLLETGNEKACSEFIEDVLPSDIREKAKEQSVKDA